MLLLVDTHLALIVPPARSLCIAEVSGRVHGAIDLAVRVIAVDERVAVIVEAVVTGDLGGLRGRATGCSPRSGRHGSKCRH